MKFSDRSGSPKKETLTDEEYESIIRLLEECQDHLALYNQWEEDFMTSVIEQCQEKKPISVRQREIVGNLHDKLTRRRSY